MDKMVVLLEEYILKAITLTENFLGRDVETEKLEDFTENRERLFCVIDQISNQVDWEAIPDDKKNDLSRQIDFIKKLDEKLVVKLQEYQIEVKKELETTHRQNESFKGYNLNDVK